MFMRLLKDSKSAKTSSKYSSKRSIFPHDRIRFVCGPRFFLCKLGFLGNGETPRNPSDAQDYGYQNQYSSPAYCYALP